MSKVTAAVIGGFASGVLSGWIIHALVLRFDRPPDVITGVEPSPECILETTDGKNFVRSPLGQADCRMSWTVLRNR